MFGYNRQIYYRSLRRQKSNRIVAEQVVSLVKEQRCILPKVGCRKLYEILKSDLKELNVGRDKLFRILRANHLLIKPKRSYHKTTNSFHRFRKHKDLVSQIKVCRPEQVWVADITYVGTRMNPMYLSIITDAYSKKIVGHNLSTSLAVDGSLKALKTAIKARKYLTTELIHHSDRGIQYCCDEYQQILIKNGIKCSMTESYDPYANAVAERVNGILKQEFIGYTKKALSFKNMRKLIEDSIDKYNSYRPHYSCYYKTPNQMHKQSEIKIRSYKKITSARASPS